MSSKQDLTRQFTAEEWIIHIGGIEALVRLTMDQIRFDRRREHGCRDGKKQGGDPKLVPSMNHHVSLCVSEVLRAPSGVSLLSGSFGPETARILVGLWKSKAHRPWPTSCCSCAKISRHPDAAEK